MAHCPRFQENAPSLSMSLMLSGVRPYQPSIRRAQTMRVVHELRMVIAIEGNVIRYHCLSRNAHSAVVRAGAVARNEQRKLIGI